MGKTADKVYSLIKNAVEEYGVDLWDVVYLKEGASRYLRVFIDSEEGITIDNCADVSRIIDPIIDRADPISESYFLEVCSPGLERELTRPQHFEKMLGRQVKVKLFKPSKGKKEIIGTLKVYDENLVLEADGKDFSIPLNEISKVILADL